MKWILFSNSTTPFPFPIPVTSKLFMAKASKRKREKRWVCATCFVFLFTLHYSSRVTPQNRLIVPFVRPSICRSVCLSVRLLVLKSPVHFSAFSVFFLCKKSDFFERGKSCKQHVSTYHKSLCPLLCLLDDRFKWYHLCRYCVIFVMVVRCLSFLSLLFDSCDIFLVYLTPCPPH